MTGLEFPTVKLRDYNEEPGSPLAHSDNPFALVVMAHLKTRATRTVPLDRLHWKTQLVRDLYRRGFERQAIVDLFRFIDWVLALPRELEQRFWDEVKRIEAEKKVQYVTTGERIGIEKGIQQGEALLLQRLLVRRFGPLPEWVEQRLQKAGREDVEAWSDRLLAADSLDEVFADKPM